MTQPLDTQAIEAIAVRVAELLRQPAVSLMTVDEVAEMLRVRPEWVYEHADELGAYRLGSGERGRLRFDRQRVLAAMERPAARRQRRPSPPRRRPSRAPDLLPVGLKR